MFVGLGGWASRLMWEGSWFPVVSSLRVLGLTWFASYDRSLELNWGAVSRSIGVAVGLLSVRPLTIYQRALLATCKFLLGVWFVARCFPLYHRRARVPGESDVSLCVVRSVPSGSSFHFGVGCAGRRVLASLTF